MFQGGDVDFKSSCNYVTEDAPKDILSDDDNVISILLEGYIKANQFPKKMVYYYTPQEWECMPYSHSYLSD